MLRWKIVFNLQPILLEENKLIENKESVSNGLLCDHFLHTHTKGKAIFLSLHQLYRYSQAKNPYFLPPTSVDSENSTEY